MKRVYVVLELTDQSTFEPASDDDLDALAEDLLCITHGVAAATVYTSADDLLSDV